MEVAITGLAAYRDEEGKLWTFEYATLLSKPTSPIKADLYIASLLRMWISSLENGENGSYWMVR